MKKLKWFTNLDKEEQWLTKMAEQGFSLCKKGFFYSFLQTAIPNPVVRIDFRLFKTKAAYNEYITLFADSGWQLLAGGWLAGKQYFIKASPTSTDDIFSDETSKAGRYYTIAQYWEQMLVSFLPLMVAFLLLWQANSNVDFFLSPKDWYQTPGLWAMEGWHFVRAFAFETPFAVMRGCGFIFSLLFFLLALVLCITYAVIARLQYKRATKV